MNEQVIFGGITQREALLKKSTGWNNGLSQDYNGKLGTWFADRLGAKQQLRNDMETKNEAIELANAMDTAAYFPAYPANPYKQVAAMLRSQAAEIDRLTKKIEDHPAPAPSGERSALINTLNRKADAWDFLHPGVTRPNTYRKSADMLAADLLEIEATTRQVEILSDELSKCSKLSQQVEVPQGWKLVPIEPTPEMVQACDAKFIPRIALPFFVAAYKTMLDAAPQPPLRKSGDAHEIWAAMDVTKPLPMSRDAFDAAWEQIDWDVWRMQPIHELLWHIQTLAATQQPAAQYPLPDSLYPNSKDWVQGDYAERVEWLHSMYENQKAQTEMYVQMSQPVAELTDGELKNLWLSADVSDDAINLPDFLICARAVLESQKDKQ